MTLHSTVLMSRLQNKQQSKAFNAARQLHYLYNPDKRPKRKRPAKK